MTNAINALELNRPDFPGHSKLKPISFYIDNDVII